MPRFSLRLLILALSLLAVVSAWLGAKADLRREERTAERRYLENSLERLKARRHRELTSPLGNQVNQRMWFKFQLPKYDAEIRQLEKELAGMQTP